MLKVYCPSCQLTFDSTQERCPECHSALKPEGREKSPAAAASGWQNPASWGSAAAAGADQEDDWNTPYGSSKTATTQAPPATPDNGEWEDDWNTPYGSSKTAATKAAPSAPDNGEWEDWVDEEPEEVQGLSPTGTEYVGHLIGGGPLPSPVKQSGKSWLVLAVALLVAFMGLYWYKTKLDAGHTAAVPAGSEASESAQVWLASAKESMAGKDYELAAAQLEKGVGYLKASGADPADIEAAQTSLAEALTLAGKLEEAHKTLSELKSPPKAKLAELARQLRIKANGQVKKAESQLKANPGSALDLARNALKLYENYGGTRAQKANALGIVGAGYVAQRNSSAAAMALRRSLDFQYDAKRAAMLSSLALPTQQQNTSSSARPTETHHPRFDISAGGSKIPKAVKPTPGEQTTVENPVTQTVVVPHPVQQDPQVTLDTSSEHKVKHPTNSTGGQQQSTGERHTNDGVLPGYNSDNRQDSRPPGY